MLSIKRTHENKNLNLETQLVETKKHIRNYSSQACDANSIISLYYYNIPWVTFELIETWDLIGIGSLLELQWSVEELHLFRTLYWVHFWGIGSNFLVFKLKKTIFLPSLADILYYKHH